MGVFIASKHQPDNPISQGSALLQLLTRAGLRFSIYFDDKGSERVIYQYQNEQVFLYASGLWYWRIGDHLSDVPSRRSDRIDTEAELTEFLQGTRIGGLLLHYKLNLLLDAITAD